VPTAIVHPGRGSVHRRRIGSPSCGVGGLAVAELAAQWELATDAAEHPNSRRQRLAIVLNDVVEFPAERPARTVGPRMA
jgi:hypothetical protein